MDEGSLPDKNEWLAHAVESCTRQYVQVAFLKLVESIRETSVEVNWLLTASGALVALVLTNLEALIELAGFLPTCLLLLFAVFSLGAGARAQRVLLGLRTLKSGLVGSDEAAHSVHNLFRDWIENKGGKNLGVAEGELLSGLESNLSGILEEHRDAWSTNDLQHRGASDAKKLSRLCNLQLWAIVVGVAIVATGLAWTATETLLKDRLDSPNLETCSDPPGATARSEDGAADSDEHGTEGDSTPIPGTRQSPTSPADNDSPSETPLSEAARGDPGTRRRGA